MNELPEVLIHEQRPVRVFIFSSKLNLGTFKRYLYQLWARVSCALHKLLVLSFTSVCILVIIHYVPVSALNHHVFIHCVLMPSWSKINHFQLFL